MTRPAGADAASARVLGELERRGLLLQAGKEFASVANLVAGEEIRGSWWAHAQSNLIYWVCQDLETHPDVTEARLVAGKVTQVWRREWSHLAAVAVARSPWQLQGLSGAARWLLAQVDEDEEDIRIDALDWPFNGKKPGEICRLLEQRLLVKAEEIHTASGRHTKRLMSWRRWWDKQGKGPLPPDQAARARIEKLVGGATKLLPWTRSATSRASR